MKYIKLLWFDIRNGMISRPVLFIVPVIVSFIACFDLFHQISIMNRAALEYQEMDKSEYDGIGAPDYQVQINGSFADCMVYIYGGMDKYVPESGEKFSFPVRWTVVFLLCPFITLNYPYNDMQGIGQQILVRTRGRTVWWMSKCAWNVLSVFVYHFLLFATAFLFCIVCGCDIVGEINKDLQYTVFRIDWESMVHVDSPWSLAIIFLPMLVSAGINLLQMMLSLFIKPMFSFLAIAFLLISSAYFMSPYIIGNYAMSMRYSIVIKDGVGMMEGLILSMALIIASVCIGLIRFRHYDVLNRD